ncbi:MAG: hypothetical protein ABIT76_08680 [Chthoniobacterales bacterium]
MKRFSRRPYEQAALVAVRERRQIGLYWTRRGRKSTTLGSICFDEMSREPGRMCIAASASLLIGKELVSVTLNSVEQAMLVLNESAAVRDVFGASAEERGLDLQVANSATNKICSGLSPDDFADLYKSSNMELRLYFDNTSYSRLQIIAPNPATARGWRALVVRDECGFTEPGFEEAMRIATDAIVRDTPDLKIVYASNLGANDKHPWFTTTLPRELTEESEDLQFPPNPRGHFYIGQHGILIHRVALQDAYATGHRLYDDSGEPMTLDECRKHPQIRAGWDQSYALNHKAGGAAAIDLFALLTAQERGARSCAFVYIENEAEFSQAMTLLRTLLGEGNVGVGYDPATTTAATSNPSSVTVTETNGLHRKQRLVVLWKERNPAIVEERLKGIFATIASRPMGGPARRFVVLATNERYFAERVSQILRSIVPTELVVESVALQPKGYDKSVNFKTYLGDIYSGAVNDNRYDLPGGDYFKDDQRMTTKNAGRYECVPDSDGKHGDTFSSGAAAEYALSAAGAAMAGGVSVNPNKRGIAGGHGSRTSRNLGGML